MESSSSHLIAITTGDADGIGLEVTLKALDKTGPKKKIKFVVFKSATTPKYLTALAKRVEKKFSSENLEFVADKRSPAMWVEDAARGCLYDGYAAMVTGPLSKETIAAGGLKDIGHTDILRRISNAPTLHMGFLGEHFNVLLATGHIALSKVSAALTPESLEAALSSAKKLRRFLSPKLQKKPIAFVGLNPHAGENGMIGHEETEVFKNFLSSHAKTSNVWATALVPDAAFLKKNWSFFSIFVCAYHDQGLIPFKMIHGHDQGVHMTLGLPFVRVSVDHGTAKDIFGKNTANPGSMISAILTAEKLVKGSLK